MDEGHQKQTEELNQELLEVKVSDLFYFFPPNIMNFYSTAIHLLCYLLSTLFFKISNTIISQDCQ